VTEPSRTVFLSYASQDVEVAHRICEALRAGGIDVFLDQSELRGGDAWDQKIRHEIHACTLFMPIISQHTQERLEGYFRHEWMLAVERKHRMAEEKAFLVPVVIDSTSSGDAIVPDLFRSVQWMRLLGGEAPPTFVERVQRLLSGEVSKEIRIGSSVRENEPASSRLKRVLPVAVAGVIAVALLVVLSFFGLERLRGLRPSAQGKSIAVLPLANESGDASQQYFSDGISEDLITALSKLPGLKVIGRTSSFQFRDSREGSRSIGAKLQVAHLLEGSVRRSGDLVRISAELIDTEDGSAQWSERFDRPYKDLFALQDEITRAVAVALQAKLLPSEAAAVQSERPPGGSLEAYSAYLQGRFYGRRGTEADYRKAIGFFTQATELDPHYALGWSGLSGAFTGLGVEFLQGAPAQEAYARARAAADRALTLSPELADAHIALGQLLYNADFDWRGAESEYRHALEITPNDARAKFAFGVQLATFGQVEQAIELTRQALATEPLRDDWYYNLANYHSALNRLDDAERAIRRALELQPGAPLYRVTLAIIEIRRGNADAALAAAQQEPPGVWQDVGLALARQIGTDRSSADAALKTLIDKDTGSSAYQIAEVYALRDDAKETFAWLDKAWSNRDAGIAQLLFDSFILRYKDDPRFAAFCRKVGLPAPAEVEGRK
jgi:TolB-like protein/Tfp pilus assembly protein PilF